MVDIRLLHDLLVVFGLGVAMVMVFHRFNMPSVLGFLVTGVVCGPYGFKLVKELHAIEVLAEIGLVLLLFEAGIEFSIKNFVRLKRFLLVAGSLQLLLTIGSAAGIAFLLGQGWRTSIFLGMLISMSSTALVIRILDYRQDLDSTYGRAALSILIFQDLCIVPMVLMVPYLRGTGGASLEALFTTGKALGFVLIAGAVARFVIPSLLSHVARTKRREAFVLSIIWLCLGTAVATSHFGLSMALGAFIAGLVISDSKYSHQALSEVLPIREVLNCLVFVSIGMLFNVRVLVGQPMLVLALLVLIMSIKTVTGFLATAATGYSPRVSLLVGVTLAQASEFSFVLSKLGYSAGILSAHVNQLFLAAAILSMFATPTAIGMGNFIHNLLRSWFPDSWGRLDKGLPNGEKVLNEHVIVVGYGVPGQKIVSSLVRFGLPFVVVEFDPTLVRSERSKGLPIIYGDASRLEVLKHAGLARAKTVVLTMSDANLVLAATELVARQNPDASLLVRARSLRQTEDLKALGADCVVVEEIASAAELTAGVLSTFSLPELEVEETIQLILRDSCVLGK
jgi:CPA2 family monovalent cation:H+ antiporter-2